MAAIETGPTDRVRWCRTRHTRLRQDAGIKPELRRQASQYRIGYALRNQQNGGNDAGEQVAVKFLSGIGFNQTTIGNNRVKRDSL